MLSNIDVMSFVVGSLVVGMHQVNFLSLSKKTVTNSFVFSRGPSMSMEMSSQKYISGVIVLRVVLPPRLLLLYFWQMSHVFSVCLSALEVWSIRYLLLFYM
jgi:hypothetical protein